jgi:hypothetical protein
MAYSAAAANAVDLPVQCLVLLFHLLDRFHRRIAARLRLLFYGQLSLLSLIAGFALRLGLDEPALFHGAGGSACKHNCNGSAHQQTGQCRNHAFRFSTNHAELSRISMPV